jgi:hypothetical protein
VKSESGRACIYKQALCRQDANYWFCTPYSLHSFEPLFAMKISALIPFLLSTAAFAAVARRSHPVLSSRQAKLSRGLVDVCVALDLDVELLDILPGGILSCVFSLLDYLTVCKACLSSQATLIYVSVCPSFQSSVRPTLLLKT